jgi:hypothetical protein
VLLATLGVDDLSLIDKLTYLGHTSDFQDIRCGILCVFLQLGQKRVYL